MLVVVLAPHDGAALKAVLGTQKAALGTKGSVGGAIDVRSVAIPESEQHEERLREEVKKLVGDAWYHEELRIDGHRRRTTQASSLSVVEVSLHDPPLEVTYIGDDGKLKLAQRTLLPFLAHDSTKAMAEACNARFLAVHEGQTAPVLKRPLKEGAAESAARNLPARAPPSTVEFPTAPSLEELEKGKIICDCPAKDGKIMILVMTDRDKRISLAHAP